MGTGEFQVSFFFLTHPFFGSRAGEGLIWQLKVADGLEAQKWVSKESGEGPGWVECVHRCVGVCPKVEVGGAWGIVSGNLHGKKKFLVLPFFSFLSIADTNVPLVFGIQLTDLTGLYIMLCSPHA